MSKVECDCVVWACAIDNTIRFYSQNSLVADVAIIIHVDLYFLRPLSETVNLLSCVKMRVI